MQPGSINSTNMQQMIYKILIGERGNRMNMKSAVYGIHIYVYVQSWMQGLPTCDQTDRHDSWGIKNSINDVSSLKKNVLAHTIAKQIPLFISPRIYNACYYLLYKNRNNNTQKMLSFSFDTTKFLVEMKHTWLRERPVCRAKRCLSASLGYLGKRPSENDIIALHTCLNCIKRLDRRFRGKLNWHY